MSESVSRLIDNLEVCRRIGVKPDTFRKRVASGQSPLPFSRQGNRTYYREKDVTYYQKEGLWPASMTFKGRARPGTAAAGQVEPGHPGLESVG